MPRTTSRDLVAEVVTDGQTAAAAAMTATLAAVPSFGLGNTDAAVSAYGYRG